MFKRKRARHVCVECQPKLSDLEAENQELRATLETLCSIVAGDDEHRTHRRPKKKHRLRLIATS